LKCYNVKIVKHKTNSHKNYSIFVLEIHDYEQSQVQVLHRPTCGLRTRCMVHALLSAYRCVFIFFKFLMWVYQ